MNENVKPIEPESYLVQRALLYKVVADPLFAKTLDDVSTNLFPSNVELYDIYNSAMTLHRKNKYSSPVDKTALRVSIAEKLDSSGVTVESRGKYDYLMTDMYSVGEENGTGAVSEEVTGMVMEHIRALSVTDAMKRAIAQDLSAEAISKFINEMHKIEDSTISSVVPTPVNVMSVETFNQQAEEVRELLTTRVPTPYRAYNLATGDGLAKGEMGCIGGKSGFGKSMHMTSLAVGYIMQGLDVVYFVLEELMPRMYHRIFKAVVDHYIRNVNGDNELTEQQVEAFRKYVSLLTLPDKMERGVYEGLIKELQDRFGIKLGNLYLMKYVPYEMTLNGLQLALTTLTVNRGIHLDVMFIDYPDLMDYDKSLGESEAGGQLFAKIRGLAQKFELITWVATQLNRGTYGAEVLTESHMEGSFRKQNALECLVIINQNQDEYEAGFTRIYVAKGRNSTHKGELIQMTVNKVTATLRDQTPLEATRHEMLLANKGKAEDPTQEQIDAQAEKIAKMLEDKDSVMQHQV